MLSDTIPMPMMASPKMRRRRKRAIYPLRKRKLSMKPPLAEGQLSLDSLDIVSVLRWGKELLRGGGKEVDYVLSQLDPVQRLAHQKKTLPGRLGLLGEYFDDEMDIDMPVVKQNGTTTPQIKTSNGHTNGNQAPPTPAEEVGLSARQLNQLKRKRKREA